MAEHRNPDRLPHVLTPDEVRRILTLVIGLVAVTDLVFGGGYLLGAPASAPSLVLLDHFGGIRTWGTGLVVAGALVLPRGPTRLWGFVLGGFVYTVWAFFSLAVLFNHTATGWGWPPYFALAAVNVIGTWSESQAATRRH